MTQTEFKDHLHSLIDLYFRNPEDFFEIIFKESSSQNPSGYFYSTEEKKEFVKLFEDLKNALR